MVIFSTLMGEYLVRHTLRRPIRRGSSNPRISVQYTDAPSLDRNMKMLVSGVAVSTLFLLIRWVQLTVHLALPLIDIV